jgi:mannose-6-phosphate isomerase-like protein (cupin superfamily)
VGQITVGGVVFPLSLNESTFAPIGEKHRLENHSSETLELIEIQVDEYLEEDDIVRFDDAYGRVESNS